MQIDVKNPNELVRETIISFLGYNYDFESTLIKIKEYLENLQGSNYTNYKKVIGVMYSNMWLLERFDLLNELNNDEDIYDYSVEDMLEFKSVEDVISYIDYCPELLDEMILQTVCFDELSEGEKRNHLLIDKDTEAYVKRINVFHVFDKLEYCRKYDKEYLVFMYKSKLIESNKEHSDLDTIKIAIKSEIKNFLVELKEYDIYNYISLTTSLIKDFYILEKYKILNNKCLKSNKKLVRAIEKLSIDNLIDLSYNDSYFLADLISSFVELNEKDSVEQEKIINVVLPNTKEHVKNKILIKP